LGRAQNGNHSTAYDDDDRSITHPAEGPAAAAMSMGWDWVGEGRVGDATPAAAAVVDWRRDRWGWARECGGEMIVIGPGIYTSGWTSGVLVIALDLSDAGC